MNWLEYVKKNRTGLDLRFCWSKPKHPKYSWRGDYIRHISLWTTRSGHARLYIPVSFMYDAGYIDLIRRSYTVTLDAEGSGAEEKLKEVFDYLTENAG